MRYLPEGEQLDIFALQERVIDSIIATSEQQIANALGPYLNSPAISRQQVNMPQPRVHLKTLKKAYNTFLSTGDLHHLVQTIQSIGGPESPQEEREKPTAIKREDLKFICYEYVWR